MTRRVLILTLLLCYAELILADDFARKAGISSRLEERYLGTYLSEDRAVRLHLKTIDASLKDSPARLRYGKRTTGDDGSLHIELMTMEKQGRIIDLKRALTGKKSPKKSVLYERGKIVFAKDDTDRLTFQPQVGPAVVLKKSTPVDPEDEK